MLTGSALIIWGAAAFALDRYGQRHQPNQTWDAVVVAGCRVRPDGTPSLALQRRTALAVSLWKQGVAPHILLTGGVGDHAPSEARAAANHAQHLGVPAHALLLEDRSTSTEENAKYAASAAPQIRKILVVTDAYHVFRTERVFARYFDQVVGVGSVGKPWPRIKGAMREVLAVGFYGAKGRL